MFEAEREITGRFINAERAILCGLGLSAIVGLSCPYFFKTDRLTTGLFLGYGTITAGLFGLSAQLRERKEKIYQSLEDADLKALKQELQGTAATHHIKTAIQSEKAIAGYVNTLPVNERVRYLQKYGLQGLVELPSPPKPEPVSDNAPTSSEYNLLEFDSIHGNSPAAVGVQEVNILDQMVETDLSTVVAAPPRTGKTCLISAWMAHLYKKYPESEVYVVAPKKDEFCGLNQIPGVVVDSDPLDPTALINGVERVYKIFLKRKESTKEERKKFQTRPVYLLLTDWYSQFTALKKTLSGKEGTEILNKVLVMLGTLVTVAPEYRVGIICDTHDFNVGSIGLAESTNLRACINLIVLGRIVTKDNGKKQGNFDAISNAIRNPSIVSEGDRAPLQQDFAEYKRQSMKTGQPIVFSTMGYPYLIGVLPNYSKYEFHKLPQEIIVNFAKKLDFKLKNQQTSASDWYEDIKRWANELGRRPTPAEVKTKWKELTNQELNDKGVQLLIENLGYKD